MSTLPTRTARRLVAPSWKDARLVVGILLVLLAVVIGSAAFSAADDRVGMWAAKHTLTPGHKITDDDFVRAEVQLGDAESDYLRVDDRLPNGAVIDRLVEPGELVPSAAVIDPTDSRRREVPVTVDPIYLSNLTEGSRVTVYVPEPVGEESDEVRYEALVERATIASLPQESGGMVGSSGRGTSAVVVVPEERVTDLLAFGTDDEPVKLVLESRARSKSAS